MKLATIAIAATLATRISYAEEAPPPPPPETKKTVDAFAGRWTSTGEFTLAGQPSPIKVTLSVDCKKTALGRAVACTYQGTTSLGPTEATLLVGYDQFSKTVHLMAMTSDGEVHDHVCRWKSDSVVCDTYKGGLGALPIVEELTIKVESKKLVIVTSMTSEGKPLSSMNWTWIRK